jgi:hypothetical protein
MEIAGLPQFNQEPQQDSISELPVFDFEKA